MSRLPSFRRASVASVVVGTIAVSAASGQAFEGLGYFPGGSSASSPIALATDGSVVFLNGRRADNRSVALRLSNGSLTELFPLANTSSVSEASGDGRMLCAVVDLQLLLCNQGVCIPLLHPGYPGASVLAASADFNTLVAQHGNAIVPMSAYFDLSRTFHAIDAAGLGTDLPYPFSNVYDAAMNGEFMVGRSTYPLLPGWHASVWRPASGWELLGDLPGGPFGPSEALAVTPDGSVIVGSGRSSIGTQAFRWQSGVFQNLGHLPGGITSRAFAVSADGQRIVGEAQTTQGMRAFVWDQENGMRAISEVLTSEYGADMTGWTLTNATIISADGSTIIGTGTTPLGSEAWIARLTDCAPVPGDVDGDRDVDLIDLATLLSNFGRVCQ